MKKEVLGFFSLLIVIFLFAFIIATNSDAINNENKGPQKETPIVKTAIGDDYGPSYSLHPPPEIEETITPSDGKSLPITESNPTIVSENAEENGNERQNLLDAAFDLYQVSQEFWSRGELGEAINALDEAYSLILNVNGDSDPEMIQQKEDLRFMISKRILEIYASRYTAVNGSHKAIPLTINEYVEYEIKQFQTVEREFFLRAYKRSGIYRPMIVKALKDAGLPEELSWLPLIESWFYVRAMSPARALGLWQFIPSTGYKFGLKRDNWIDERLDPEKSTSAAIAYLQELHKIFGDWTTVLAAYNCGEGNVLRIIKEQKINYLDNFWDLFERLPRETARYVPRFLATLLIINEPEQYGFDLEETEKPVPFEVVKIEKQVKLDSIAKELGISEGLLSDLNAELRQMITPPGPYNLRVPSGKADLLLARIDSIPRWSQPEKKFVYHRVRKGETLSSIATRYKTTVEAILKANNIKKRRLIRAGKMLKIPLRVYASRSSGQDGGKYRIKKGDSLWLVAKKFNTDVETLKRINNLKSSNLAVGQIIRVMD